MNKTFKNTLFGLALTIPFSVYASSGSMAISCDKTSLTPGEKTTCSVLATSSEKLFGVTGNISLSGNIALDSTLSYHNGFAEPTGNNSDLNFSLVSADGVNASRTKVVSFQIKNTGSTVDTATVSVGSGGMSVGDIDVNSISASGGSATINLIEKTVTTAPQENTEKSTDANLKTLTIENLPFDFNPNTYVYDLTASKDITELVINAKTNNKKAKIEIPEDLHIYEGLNTFIITVIAEDKTEKEYTINVTIPKDDSPEPGIVSSLLYDLKIDGYTINFDKNKFIYDIKNVKKKKLDIIYTTEDENAIVEIIGNNDIEKNDVIVLRVTSSNGEVTDYILKVNNNLNIPLIIASGLFAISVVGWIVILLKKKGGKRIETL